VQSKDGWERPVLPSAVNANGTIVVGFTGDIILKRSAPTGTAIGPDCLERLQKRESTTASCGHLIRFTPHVDFVLVLVGYAKSEPVIKPARGIDFHHSKSDGLLRV
jgi:hypothetical protein